MAKSADATSFVAAASRAVSVLDALLGADDTSVTGIVCSDMYAAYGCLDQLRFTHAWCWVHVRRDIIRAAKSAKVLDPWAGAWHARRAGTGLTAAIAAGHLSRR